MDLTAHTSPLRFHWMRRSGALRSIPTPFYIVQGYEDEEMVMEIMVWGKRRAIKATQQMVEVMYEIHIQAQADAAVEGLEDLLESES